MCVCVFVQVEAKEAPFADPFKNAFRQSDAAPSGPPVGRKETKAESKARKKVRAPRVGFQQPQRSASWVTRRTDKRLCLPPVVVSFGRRAARTDGT